MVGVQLTTFRKRILAVLQANGVRWLSTSEIVDRAFEDPSGCRRSGLTTATRNALQYLLQRGLVGYFQTSSGRFVYTFWFDVHWQEKGG